LWRKEYVGIFLACRDNTRDYEFASGHLEFQLDKIRSYFLTQSNRERGSFQSPFVGIYYFWGEFARVTVPFIMGRRSVNLLGCLSLPSDLIQILGNDSESTNEYHDFVLIVLITDMR